MADGKQKPPAWRKPRSAAPHVEGPLGSSGAAPDTGAVPEAVTTPEPGAGTPAPAASPAADQSEPAKNTADRPEPAKPAADRPEPAKPAAVAPTAAAATIPSSPPTGAAGAAAAGTGAGRTARVLRAAHPVRAARSAGRTTMAWARRPSGRLIIPALLAVLLIGIAGTAGAYLVPKALDGSLPPSGAPSRLPDGAPDLSGAPTVPGAVGARPADALAGWAQQVGTRVGIPVVAVQAYGYAELVLSRTAPACRLSWTTIAAIAKVESDHGSANGAVLGVDGQALPAIVGLPLDGNGGRQLIKDTDQGALDGDTVYDRAMGPLQFIPTTWRQDAIDADNNGVTDPNDVDDASLAAGMYLCRNGRDMSRADDWWAAILSYNDVRPYAQKVFDQANDYGIRSRT